MSGHEGLSKNATPVGNEEYNEEPEVRIIFILAMTIFSIAGFIGNSLIIATIALVADLRTTRNAFLINFAVSDLVLIVIVVPYNVLSGFDDQNYLVTHNGVTRWYEMVKTTAK
ncbi:hypothetical protein RvY_04535 [Ramazzottius varieornatus]|uniref:G-protein coupled receptors family 1 profile domain-containing protein n=1 Tax=Ramazzottius varieornatus TaxID=947166 RepID=A0A1D1UYP3_RAMVA|nr:hypothetical protein RvY_04535 [Ramazzottius varieornatus]